MSINTAMVGAFGINWLNSRGDIVLAFKARGQGFESHPGKLFQFFFAFISYFFQKKNISIFFYFFSVASFKIHSISFIKDIPLYFAISGTSDSFVIPG